MRLPTIILFLLLGAVHCFATDTTQIHWEASLESAKAKAKLEGKPVLLLHLFGRLDQEYT